MAFSSPSTPAKPNAGNIMATLRMLRDDELLKYAEIHKNDPYIFPLTFQESNARKQVRAEQSAQDNPTTQVVDQNLQEMAAPAPQMAQAMPPQQLPEDSGIGQLSAPNMQGMAEGGIVAFEEGGEVPRFQEGGFFRPSGVPSGAIIIGNMYIDPVTKERKYIPGQEPQRSPYAGQTLGQAAGRVGDFLSNLLLTPEQEQQKIKPDARRTAIAAENKQDIEDSNARALSEQIAAATGTGIGTPTTPAPGGPAVPAVPAVPAMPAMPTMPTMGGLPSLGAAPKLVAPTRLDETRQTADDAKAAANTFFNANEAKTALQTYQDKEAADVAARRTKTEQGLAALPKRYEDYEKRLKAQEKEDAGDKEKLTGMSFLEAGLAVLSGESPHAFVNLGRAKEGVKTYNEGIKDIKKSARERDKAFADIENARQAQEEGKLDKMQAFEQSAATRMSAARGNGINGLMKVAEISGTTAAGLYNNAENNYFANKRVNIEQAGHTDRTNAQIAAQLQNALIGERGANTRAEYNAKMQAYISSLPSGQLKLFEVLGKGDVEAGMKKFLAAGGEQKQETKLLSDYMDMKPMERMLFKRDNPGLAAQFDALIQSKLPLMPVTVDSARP